MNRNQFNTNANDHKDNYSAPQQQEQQAVYKFKEQDSDSGEDFYYGEEEEEESAGNSGAGELDLMQFISNMDVSNISGTTNSSLPQ
jgi:hypothetical protein